MRVHAGADRRAPRVDGLRALTIASGFFTLKVPSIDSRLSISELFAFACVLQFGPEAGAITLAVDGIFVSIRHRLSMAQAAFNFAMLLLSVWTSGIVFFALSGSRPSTSATRSRPR